MMFPKVGSVCFSMCQTDTFWVLKKSVKLRKYWPESLGNLKYHPVDELVLAYLQFRASYN